VQRLGKWCFVLAALLPRTPALAAPAFFADEPRESQHLAIAEQEMDTDIHQTRSKVFLQWQTSKEKNLSGEQRKARAILADAKKLIVDSFPEDRSKAELMLIDAIRLAPSDPLLYAELSRFVLWQVASGIKEPSDIQLTTALAAHVRELSPYSPLGNYVICEILVTVGQAKQADALFRETAARFPLSLETSVFEVRYFAETEPERALISAQKALAQGHPMDDLSPAIATALQALAKRKGESPGEALAKFASIYPDRWLWHRAGMAFADEKLWEKARYAYEQAVRLGNETESRLQLGVLEYTALKEYESASAHLEQVALRLRHKENVPQSSLALVASHRAISALAHEEEQDATQLAYEALNLAGDNANILVPLTEEFLKKKKGQLLVNSLEEVARNHPMHEYVHLTLANLASERKDLESAFDHFTSALALSPGRDDLYAARGHVAYKRLKYEEALRDFERASSLDPKDANHIYNIACMASLLGKKEQAITSLKNAIKLNENLRSLALRDEDFAPLRKDPAFAEPLKQLGLWDEPESVSESESLASKKENKPPE
jgi:tetratricopeptide (TPR) repeat protein